LHGVADVLGGSFGCDGPGFTVCPSLFRVAGSLTSRNGLKIISKSLARIAKKKQPDDVEGFTKAVMQNIETTTDASVDSVPP
jgi:hypothetical protein